MTISPGLAAELTLLSQGLDEPGVDVAATLARLAIDAHSAVGSYLGLSVAIMAHSQPFHFTMLAETADTADIATSLHFALLSAETATSAPASIALTLYAGTPGAFVDLAADLSWITGRIPADFRLDEHRTLPLGPGNPVSAMSRINQALGVLIGQGSSPEQAERELYAHAVAADLDLLGAATLILAGLSAPEPDKDDTFGV